MAMIKIPLFGFNISVASLLLQRGWSPLMEAARGGFKEIVEELAKRGADLDIRTVRLKNA